MDPSTNDSALAYLRRAHAKFLPDHLASAGPPPEDVQVGSVTVDPGFSSGDSATAGTAVDGIDWPDLPDGPSGVS